MKQPKEAKEAKHKQVIWVMGGECSERFNTYEAREAVAAESPSVSASWGGFSFVWKLGRDVVCLAVVYVHMVQALTVLCISNVMYF